LENLVGMSKFWVGKKVFLTGHTGFKGSWLSLWLHLLGAKVFGYSHDPESPDCIFQISQLSKIITEDNRADLTDFNKLEAALQESSPDIIFHLAAQALVKQSYQDPVNTFSSNIMGTTYLLEAARKIKSVKAIVVITTDKVYENKEWEFPYRENDRLGGHDPYAASKACTEIITASFRASFYNQGDSPALATARAGNVIGGGDWAKDRLIPDCIRAFTANQNVQLRFPNAIRPWQFVLEPLYGYLKLAEELTGQNSKRYREAWNFGPESSGDASVGKIAVKLGSLWGDGKVDFLADSIQEHEASTLRLDITKSKNILQWKPQWAIDRSLEETIKWYKAWHQGRNMYDFSCNQVELFSKGT
jgi:CDP-glucose 4,6-dehydratase